MVTTLVTADIGSKSQHRDEQKVPDEEANFLITTAANRQIPD